jgi:hypothetical protein
MFTKKSGFIFLVLLDFILFQGKLIAGGDPPVHPSNKQLSVTGFVTVDGLPESSEIQINSLLKNDKTFLKIQVSKSTGLFNIDLPTDDVYELVIEVKHFPPQIIELSTLNMDTVFSLNAYADFTSPAYDKKLEELILSSGRKIKADTAFRTQSFEQIFGNSTKNELSYSVQIAAFKFFENFNYTSVIGMPKIIRQVDKDYITRFTMGHFESYNQALILLQQLQKNKLEDAFIIATYNGEKKFLKQLIEEKILE